MARGCRGDRVNAPNRPTEGVGRAGTAKNQAASATDGKPAGAIASSVSSQSRSFSLPPKLSM